MAEKSIYEKRDELMSKIMSEYNLACCTIQALKSPWGIDPYMSAPTLANVSVCRTLPRIERICKNAKYAYIQALNLPGRAEHPKKVREIFNTSNVYYQAISMRKELMNKLKEARAMKDRAIQQIQSLKLSKSYVD